MIGKNRAVAENMFQTTDQGVHRNAHKSYNFATLTAHSSDWLSSSLLTNHLTPNKKRLGQFKMASNDFYNNVVERK